LRAFDPFLQGPGLRDGAAIGWSEPGAIVPDLEPHFAIFKLDRDIDAVGRAVADGIGDRLTKKLLKVELEADRDRGVIARRTDSAPHVPLLL
jgi:hypothetical protein